MHFYCAVEIVGIWQVASWGGYSFIINLLPIHCLACVVTGRLTPKLYIAYAPFVVLGTLTAGAELLPCSHGIYMRLSDIWCELLHDKVKLFGELTPACQVHAVDLIEMTLNAWLCVITNTVQTMEDVDE